jgi:hypothetical protein
LWARRERREKRAERVARGRSFMISLGIPSGPGALPVSSEFIVLSNLSRVIMSARVREVSPRGHGLDPPFFCWVRINEYLIFKDPELVSTSKKGIRIPRLPVILEFGSRDYL